MVVSMKEIGSETNFMGRVCILGQTAVPTKVNTSKIKNKVTESMFGQMEKNMKANGLMASSTVLVNLLILLVNLDKVNGQTENEFAG